MIKTIIFFLLININISGQEKNPFCPEAFIPDKLTLSEKIGIKTGECLQETSIIINNHPQKSASLIIILGAYFLYTLIKNK